MNGMARASGAPVPIKFAGKSLLLDPLTIKDLGTIEQLMLDKLPDPLELVMPAIDKLKKQGHNDLAEKLIERAYNDAMKANKIPDKEVAAFIDTIEGMAYTFWICFGKRYGTEYSLEYILEHMQNLAEDNMELLKKLKDQRDQASTLDELGNSTGPTLNVDAPSGKKLAKRNPTRCRKKKGPRKQR